MRRKKDSKSLNISLTDAEEGIVRRMINYKGRTIKIYNPKLEKRKKILDKDLTQDYGWLTHKEIEHNQTDKEPRIYDEYVRNRESKRIKEFSHPMRLSKTTSNRQKYLRKWLVGKGIIEYKKRKFYGSNGSKDERYEFVYRIIPDDITFLKLIWYFDRQNLLYEFARSDYYRGHKTLKSLRMLKEPFDWIDSKIIQLDKLHTVKNELKEVFAEYIDVIIPPSLVKALLSYDRVEHIDAFDFDELWKAYLIYDYTHCSDDELQNYYWSIIELIDNLPARQSFDEVKQDIDKIKASLRTNPESHLAGTKQKQEGGQNEEKK